MKGAKLKLKLKKEIIENTTLSNEALMVYLGIVLSYRPLYQEIPINYGQLNYYLNKTTAMPQYFDKSLRKGLKQLINDHVVTCIDKTKTEYFLGTKNIKLEDTDKFIFVDVEDVHKIMQSDCKSKNAVLRLYLCMLGTFIGKNHIKDIRDPDKYNNILGMMSQQYLSDISKISRTSVIEYMKVLEELELIYVSRCSALFQDKYGNIKQHNNIYGKYSDRELIDEFTKIRYEMYDDFHNIKSKITTNNARSLAQKYNCLANKTKYDKETVAEIYKYVCDYNEKYPNKAKDMTPFVKYGYKVDKKVE